MHTFLLIMIFISSVILILSVLLQEGKNSGLSSSVSGNTETLFGKNKARGLQALLQRITVVSGAVFMISVFLFGLIKASIFKA